MISRGTGKAWLAWVLGTISGCGSGADPGAELGPRVPLEIYAASSLTEAFEEMEDVFEAVHPDTDVLLTFAGSQVLRVQIQEGARADVFASANQEHLDSLVAAGRVREGQVFARNELVVIVPLSNPAGIETFDDLPLASRLVLGTENVPAGSYAREVLQRANRRLGSEFAGAVLSNLVSEEANVRLVRAKVELDEADAAIVYRTDAVPSDRVRVIDIPEAGDVRADYPMGVVTDSSNPEGAAAWVDFVLSAEGRTVLTKHGFLLP